MIDEQFNAEFKRVKEDVLVIALDGSKYVLSEQNIEAITHAFYLLGKTEGMKSVRKLI